MHPNWSRIYRDELDSVLNYFHFRIGNMSQAEDLCARTFELAWRRRRTFDGEKGRPRQWLVGIARRVVVGVVLLFGSCVMIQQTRTSILRVMDVPEWSTTHTFTDSHGNERTVTTGATIMTNFAVPRTIPDRYELVGLYTENFAYPSLALEFGGALEWKDLETGDVIVYSTAREPQQISLFRSDRRRALFHAGGYRVRLADGSVGVVGAITLNGGVDAGKLLRWTHDEVLYAVGATGAEVSDLIGIANSVEY